MGKIISSYIFPHPPIIVPEVGKGGENGAASTVNAVKRAAKDIRNDKPTTIIVTTPHAPIFQDFIYISASEVLTGNLGRFGCSKVSLSFRNNIALVNSIIGYAKKEGIYSGGLEENLIRRYNISKELDHGALVPLYYISKEINDFKLVHMSVAGLPLHDLYKFGMCISRAIDESAAGEQVVFVASGDLSHRLSHDAPYGYNKCGREFDELFVQSIKELDIEKLLNIEESFSENAGECGLRSFIMMFGALDKYDLIPEVYSYEGPFGVGYAVARFSAQRTNSGRQDPYVALARMTLETYIRENKILEVPEGLPDEMIGKRAGTFVSIKKYGQLRGCIGTIGPTRKSIAEEIIYNAVSAGTRDPRFDSVKSDELDDLVYSVDVLKEAEPVKSINELDVIKYGVIVKSGMRSGLLLPNLEGVDNTEKQLSVALQKAGIRPDEEFSMERFEVIRHK